MNYRQALLLSPQDLGSSGTKVVDIDIHRPISRILVKFKTTKATQGMAAPAPANIPKIELVDGSTPLHSLTGFENQALAYYNHKNISMEHGQHIATLSEVDMYHIDFGRYLWDRQLAFLPTKFINPQLKITWDEDVADTSVTENECEIWAYVFDQVEVAPIGFLSAIEHYAYTCGAENSYEEVEIPEDRVIRQILVRAYRDGYEPWAQIDEVRFDENSLERIPWEFTNLEEYYRWMKANTRPLITPLAVEPTTSARTYYVPQTDFWASVNLTPVATSSTVYIDGASMKGGKAALIASASAQMIGHAFGYLPWHCFQLPMGLPHMIDDWYNPKGKKPRLRLRAASSGTNGTAQVVLETLWKY